MAAIFLPVLNAVKKQLCIYISFFYFKCILRYGITTKLLTYERGEYIH